MHCQNDVAQALPPVLVLGWDLSGVTCISTPSAAFLRSRGAAAALFTKTRTGSRFRAPQSESRSEGDERSAGLVPFTRYLTDQATLQA